MTWGEAKAIAATAAMRALPRLTEPQAQSIVKEAFDDIIIELIKRNVISPMPMMDSEEIPLRNPYWQATDPNDPQVKEYVQKLRDLLNERNDP